MKTLIFSIKADAGKIVNKIKGVKETPIVQKEGERPASSLEEVERGACATCAMNGTKKSGPP